MQIRDRIVELRPRARRQLAAAPQQLAHAPAPAARRACGALAEIGCASALLVRELADGSLELIDGHLRAETMPDALVPVLVLDLNAAEAAKLLATFDPLSSLAGWDTAALEELLKQVETEDPALRALLDGLIEDGARSEQGTAGDAKNVAVPEMYQVIVECADEAQQQDVYEQMTAQGIRCRLQCLG